MYNHNDKPSIVDMLNRTSWQKMILNQIKESDAPKVIGINGTWGTGKTSAMAQIYTTLGGIRFDKEQGKKNENMKFQPVWFEAWQYQHEENILVALLQEIRNQLVFRYKLLKKMDETITVSLLSILQSIDLTINIFGGKFGIKNLGNNIAKNVKEYETENFSKSLDSVMMKKMLQDAIDQLLKLDDIISKISTKEKRVAVIFIDDLDRCEPETAFRILESIKVYLDLENTVFVLGMDIFSVEKMLTKYYVKQVEGTGKINVQELANISRLYLEKICQDIYHIPVLDEKEKNDFFLALINDSNIHKPEDVSIIIERIELLLNEYDFLPPFPRSIKMYVNIILTHLRNEEMINKLKTKDSLLKHFLIFTYLYTFHYDIYVLITSYSEFYNGVLLSYCSNPILFENENGEHNAFKSIILKHSDNFDSEISGSSLKESYEKQIVTMYPHANLRNVLWINNLIINASTIGENEKKLLKL